MPSVGERLERLVDVPRGVLVEVVLDHEPAIVVDAAHELVELEAHEAAVDAELDDVELDLLGDPADHLGALQHRDHVAHGHEVLDLERGELGGDLDEAVLVALEGLQRLVGPVSSRGIGSSACFWSPGVDGDDGHVLGHRDHRHVDRSGHPLGRAVAGAGLGRGHVRVRHEVHVGPGDAAGVGGEDDGAVHLRQLRQPLRAERGVEQEAARADVEHVGTVAHDDQGAHAGLQDAVEAGAQRRARAPPRRARRGARRCAEGPSHSMARDRTERSAQVHGEREAAASARVAARRHARMPAAARRARWPARPPGGSPGGPPRPGGGRSGAPGAARRRGPPRRRPRGRRRTARPERADTSARASARSAPGSTTFTPPATTAWTSSLGHAGADALVEHGEHQRQAAAVEALGRAPRRGQVRRGSTSACTSTSSGRCPSSTGATTEPGDAGAPVGEEQRRRVGHAGAGRRPVISNRPSSSVEPNRCLVARSSRSAWWRSPSNDSTVSTRCSSTRGPARPPSLVTWPTRIVASDALLGRPHEVVGAVAHLGDRAGCRRQRRVEHGLDGVDGHHVGPHLGRGGRARWAATSRPPATGWAASAPSRSARSRTCWADSSAVTTRQRLPALARPASAWSSRVDFPIPGSPPSRVTDPGTSPPWSTRSSSPIDVGIARPGLGVDLRDRHRHAGRRQRRAVRRWPRRVDRSPRPACSTPRRRCSAPPTWAPRPRSPCSGRRSSFVPSHEHTYAM